MLRLLVCLAAFLAGAPGFGADPPGAFSGEWKTTMGPVSLTQNGPELSGKLVAWNLAVKGKAAGKGLTLAYDEGSTHVDASWELDASGNAFKGRFQASNGNNGIWHGWRPDPSALKAAPANFSGQWLTDLGLMELKQDGLKVTGRYAFRGTSSFEGEVHGRHLEGRIKAFRAGSAWFDIDESGTVLSGAGGTDGMPAWYGWKGRKAPEFVRHVPLVAGQLVDGSTDGLLTYTVRAPQGYKLGDGKKWPVVLIFHGANMNGRAYVATIASVWPDIARDAILLGINGEIPTNISADYPSFNYTYINYVGRSTFKGFGGTDRESPALVREAMDELKKVYPIRHYIVGGHSQGGYLTYSLLMNSPESIAGAFAISAGVIMQCEPSAFADEALKAAQRAVPLAIVHGPTDPLVPFTSAVHANNLFLDAGWTSVRLFTDENAGHMFARLPVGTAISWLGALGSDDPKVLLDFAEGWLAHSGRRDAIAAIRRARGLKLDAPAKARLDRMMKEIEVLSATKAKTFLAAIQANQDNTWIDDFLAFRDEFEYAESAATAMAAFNELRQKQTPPATKLMAEARVLFQQGKRTEGYAKAREVVDKYYASPSYRIARRWINEQK